MSCAECGGGDCMHLYINLAHDEVVSFYECNTCGAQWWARRGETISLDQVISLTEF